MPLCILGDALTSGSVPASSKDRFNASRNDDMIIVDDDSSSPLDFL